MVARRFLLLLCLFGTSVSVWATAPPPPANLTTRAVGSKTIELNWTGHGLDEGYKIERCTGTTSFCDANSWSFVEVGQEPRYVQTHRNSGLEPLTTYSYRVRSFNEFGFSGYSNIAEGTTLEPGPPSMPGGLHSGPASATQIDLSWEDNADNEDGITIERCTGWADDCDLNTNFSFAEIDRVGPNVTVYSDTVAQPDTTQSYRVRAFNIHGSSDYSNTSDATTPSLGAPAPPSNLASAAISPTKIRLDWTDNSTSETGFVIERCSPGLSGCGDEWWYFPFESVGVADANATTFTDTGALPSRLYYHRVRAFNDDGNSIPSNIAEAWTPPPPPAPPAPTGLSATATSPTRVDLSWTDNASDEAGTRIERCVGTASSCAASFDFISIAQVGPDVTSYSDAALTPKTTSAIEWAHFETAAIPPIRMSMTRQRPARHKRPLACWRLQQRQADL